MRDSWIDNIGQMIRYIGISIAIVVGFCYFFYQISIWANIDKEKQIGTLRQAQATCKNGILFFAQDGHSDHPIVICK